MLTCIGLLILFDLNALLYRREFVSLTPMVRQETPLEEPWLSIREKEGGNVDFRLKQADVDESQNPK